MPGKWHFAIGREDTHLVIGARRFRWKDEGRFGQIHLAGDALHSSGIQPDGIGKDSQRIATERLIGEYIDLIKAVSGHANITFVGLTGRKS